MKFRAIIRDHKHLNEFSSTSTALSKLGRESVLNIGKDKLYFIMNEKANSTSPLVWIEINCLLYFDEYTMDGMDVDHENILLSFNSQDFAQAVNSLRKSATFFKIKLTNNQFPCLTIEIDLPSEEVDTGRQTIHHVPVSIIPIHDWPGFVIPQRPNSDIILSIKSLGFLINLIDKIKNLTPSITLCGTNTGILAVICETDSSTVASYYRNLVIKKPIETILRNSGEDQTEDEVSCLIDCKKIGIFLSSLVSCDVQLACGIVHDHVVHMEVKMGTNIVINCILAAVCV